MGSYRAVALFQARLWVNGTLALVLLAAHLLVGQSGSTRGLVATIGFSLALALPLAAFFAGRLRRPIQPVPTGARPRSPRRTRWEVAGITAGATAPWLLLVLPLWLGDATTGRGAAAGLYLAVILGIFACVDALALGLARRTEQRAGAPVFLSRGRVCVEVAAPTTVVASPSPLQV